MVDTWREVKWLFIVHRTRTIQYSPNYFSKLYFAFRSGGILYKNSFIWIYMCSIQVLSLSKYSHHIHNLIRMYFLESGVCLAA